MINMVFRERILINSMLSVAPNMTQNAERKHRTQNTNTAPIRPQDCVFYRLIPHEHFEGLEMLGTFVTSSATVCH